MAIFRFFTAILFVFAFSSASSAQTVNEKSSIDTIRNLQNSVILTIENDSLSAYQKQERFNELLDDSFNIRLMGKFVLGNHWRNISSEQRQEFLTTYKNFLMNGYSATIGEYSGKKLRIDHANALSDTETMVYTEVENEGDINNINWRIRDGKIIDIIVKKISFIATQRAEFSASINKFGIDWLINRLKNH